MKITNKYNLNPMLLKWLKFDEYDYHPGIYSATTLFKPIRATKLSERHWDELTTDASDMINSRSGTGWHDSMEKALKDVERYVTEQRFFHTIEVDGKDVTISGKMDVLEVGEDFVKIHDHKETKVWKYILEEKHIDWITQLSIYRWLVFHNWGVLADDIAGINIKFNDWQKKKAREDPGYPEIALTSIEIELLPLDETEDYVRTRLKELYDADDLADDDLPWCTDEELWRSQEKWAVIGKGNKRATKVFDFREEAESLARILTSKQKKDYVAEHRPGVVKRCNYCVCRPVCNQYAHLMKNNEVAEE